MKNSQFSEWQIVFALRQAELGTPVEEIIRKMGICQQTFYRWEKQYKRFGHWRIARLRQLE